MVELGLTLPFAALKGAALKSAMLSLTTFTNFNASSARLP